MTSTGSKNDLPANSLGIVKPKRARFDDALSLAGGGQLSSYELVYETYGKLNAAGSNGVLICHALSSDHHAAGYSEREGDSYTEKNSWMVEFIDRPGQTR